MVTSEFHDDGNKDPTEGKGQPVSEGDSLQPADNNAPSSSTAPAGGPTASVNASGGSGAGPDGAYGERKDDGAGAGEDGGSSAGTGVEGGDEDDPEPDPELMASAKSVALAEVMKPVAAATEDLFSKTPDKKKARQAINDAYKKAFPELRAKYEVSDTSFVSAANIIGEKLDDWIESVFTDDGAVVAAALIELVQVRTRLHARGGERENERAKAQAITKWWADRFADWAAPAARIAALIVEPTKIDQLKADVKNGRNADAAIFSFWFEYAPKHLQLRADADDLEPYIDTLNEALTRIDADLAEEFARRFTPGIERDDGGLYLIPPDDTELDTRRKDVLASWNAAADEQAEAEAAYKLRPDDAAMLKQRWDKLKDDGWLKDVKSTLEKPAA